MGWLHRVDRVLARWPACQPVSGRPPWAPCPAQPPASPAQHAAAAAPSCSLDEFTAAEGAEPLLTEFRLHLDTGACTVRRFEESPAAYGDFPVVHPGLVGEWPRCAGSLGSRDEKPGQGKNAPALRRLPTFYIGGPPGAGRRTRYTYVACMESDDRGVPRFVGELN